MFYTGTGAVLGSRPAMVIAIIPLIIATVGLLMYALAANPKVQEAGRLMFFAGILVLTFVFARQTVSVG